MGPNSVVSLAALLVSCYAADANVAHQGTAGITARHGPMRIEFNIEDVNISMQVDYNEFNASLAGALKRMGLGSDTELSHYVPTVRSFMIRTLNYPPSLEVAVPHIKNRSRAEESWPRRRRFAQEDLRKLAHRQDTHVTSPIRLMDTAVFLSQPIASNERHQGAGLWRMRVIRQYVEHFRMDAFVETGTFEGQTIDAVVGAFPHIWSVEYDRELFRKAKARFAEHPNVAILHGDSSKVLPKILSELNTAVLFWLDAHYEGGALGEDDGQCPLFDELRHILTHRIRDHVILIDDARVMNGKDECYYEDWNDRSLCDWPSIADVHALVCELRPEMHVYLADDILRIHSSSVLHS